MRRPRQSQMPANRIMKTRLADDPCLRSTAVTAAVGQGVLQGKGGDPLVPAGRGGLMCGRVIGIQWRQSAPRGAVPALRCALLRGPSRGDRCSSCGAGCCFLLRPSWPESRFLLLKTVTPTFSTPSSAQGPRFRGRHRGGGSVQAIVDQSSGGNPSWSVKKAR